MRRSVRIYGKAGCDRCVKAKEKFDRLGIPYEYHDLPELLNDKCDNWKERYEEVISLKAETCMNDGVPIIWVKDHGYLQYAAAIKAAKHMFMKGDA